VVVRALKDNSISTAHICVIVTLEQLTFEQLPGTGADKHIYRLNGPLVLPTMFAIQGILRSESVNTILDLTGVPYVDSAGVGVLTNAYVAHQRHGRRFLLAGVNDRVMTALKVTGLEKLFEVFPTVENAIESLGDPAQQRGAA
jgi:anti-sigma B factor antagonist